MKKLIFSLFVVSSTLAFSQEICDNGVDDDGDLLVDMNDPDCACAGFGGGSTTVTSLIPNPSFESNSCCPSSVSQLNCADNWIQASNATSDYFNLCGYSGIFNTPNTPIPGGGQGYGGFYSNVGWEENIGNCLSSPMIAGTSYTLQLWTAWSVGSTTLDLHLFGTPNCGDLPWGTSNCSVGNGGWQILGSVTVNYASNQSWQQVTITFTPTVNINAVSLGGPCGGMAGTNYYFVDELTLATSSSFSPGSIAESGSWCTNDLLLTADPDTTGGSFQWFDNGVAIPGETGSTLDIMSYGAGTYNCVYTIGTDCVQMDYTVTIPGAPTSNFNFVDQCAGNAINFTNTSTVTPPAVITGYNWDFGDGNTSTAQNPSNNYASDGTYNVSLTITDDNGCQNTMNQTVTVFPNPVNDFEFVVNGVSSTMGATGGCLVDPVSFVNNSSINAPDNIANWNWDFGDGNTSTAQNPGPHTYATEGNYTIQLNTTSNNGCTDVMNIPITIYPSPVAVYTVTDNCLDFPATFVNNSNITSGIISTYQWDLGDGNTSSAQNPGPYNYASEGTYTTELVVISDQGCTDTLQVATTQHPEPVADFTMSSECIVDPSTISNSSSVNAPDNISVWSWDFDDGNTSAAQNPGTHSYLVEATYNVMLAVETNNGCQDTLIVPVTVDPSPVATFTVNDDCMDIPAAFNNNSNISSGVISTTEWDFGDGNTASILNPSHLYPGDGTYNVQLIVTSDQGCKDTFTLNTTRFPLPVPNFTVADVCEYNSITPNDLSTINAPDNIASWDWDLGDGNTTSGAAPSYNYAQYGNYNVTLTTTSNNGCTASITNPVLIHAQPLVDFIATDVCINQPPSTFTDNSSVPGGSIGNWNWDFDDGMFGAGPSLTHPYANDGVYNVELEIISAFGCLNSIIKPINVFEMPLAAFYSDKNAICSPDVIVFTDASQTSASTLTDWQWEFFGGSGTNTGSQVNVTYTNDGSTPIDYDVQLVVTNSFGCKDTAIYSQYITVYPTPEARFTAIPNELNLFETETQFNNGSLNSDEWEWNFGDGSLISLQENPSHIFPNDNPDLYPVQLIAYNYGRMCSDTARLILEVKDVIIFYVPNIFTPDGDEFNETWKPVFYSGHDIYDFHLILFNRWGEIVWESYNADAGWNGHYGNGGLVDDGTYIWQVDFKETMSDKRHKHRGHVTVLK